MAVTINASTSNGLIQTADTSGQLQLQTSGVTALTLDASQNATFAGTVTATSYTGSGANLTGVGGLTLLSTLTTTSGTTVTASGLNLTSYKMIWCFFSGVTPSSNSTFYITTGTGTNTTISALSNSAQNGNIYFDLISGIGSSQFIAGGTISAKTFSSGYTTASTSIAFNFGGTNTFTAGTIYIYGSK
jgi:hypothetical protein